VRCCLRAHGLAHSAPPVGFDMKCFYHNDGDAVGICRACGKGVCPGCAREVPKALACSGRCEDELRGLSDLKKDAEKAKSSHIGFAIFLTCLGALFVVWGVLSEELSIFTVAIGSLFLGFGTLTLFHALSMKSGASADPMASVPLRGNSEPH
jgi:hypothetical protein